MSPANQKAYFERLYLKIEKCLFVTTFFFFFSFSVFISYVYENETYCDGGDFCGDNGGVHCDGVNHVYLCGGDGENEKET